MNPSAVLLSSSLATLRSGFCTKLSILVPLIFFCHLSFGQRSPSIDTSGPNNSPKDNSSSYNSKLIESLTQSGGCISAPGHIQLKKRKWIVAGVNIAGYGGSLVLLNSAWYKGYARTDFHTFNDSKEWLQVDKLGHAWGAYNAGKTSAAMWKWAGVPSKKAALIGALSSTAYLTGIEFMDAHSAKWGWSWSDICANITGGGLFVGQEYLWNEQRIQFKFSFHIKNYADPVLDQRANNLFGDPWYERMLKDYNAQTYWFSANLRSFFRESNLPKWLNVSVGYGADGMYGGFENKWTDKLGNEIDRSGIPRKRQFYLAPDIDFTKIETNKKWLRTVFTFLNAFKFPAPALMIDSKGKLKGYALYF